MCFLQRDNDISSSPRRSASATEIADGGTQKIEKKGGVLRPKVVSSYFLAFVRWTAFLSVGRPFCPLDLFFRWVRLFRGFKGAFLELFRGFFPGDLFLTSQTF